MKLVLALMLLLSFSVYSQEKVDFNRYEPLKSSKKLPACFLSTTSSKTQQHIKENADEDDKRYIENLKKNFSIKGTYYNDYLIFSGRILSGDPVTDYISKVAAELLKDSPELLKSLQFYALKSSSVNAFSTSTGTIMVSLGLISQLKNEAELAYVLAHEIVHYEKKHGINQAIESYEVLKGKGNNTRKSFEEKLDHIYEYEKQDEFEADSIGLLRFLKSEYAFSSAESLMDLLLHAYLPYEQKEFDLTFFDKQPFVVPQCYFADTVADIKIDDTYEDRYESHPSIRKRKAAVERIVKRKGTDNAGLKEFIVSEDEFKYVQEVSRFEIVRLDVLRRNYGNAIYNAFLLMDEYPNNEFLETAVAKSLYGLSKYKTIDEFHRVARSYMSIQGESQQLHFFFRQLNKTQLNVLALQYIMAVADKYSENRQLIKYRDDLMKDLVVENEVKASDLFAKRPSPQVLNKLHGQTAIGEQNLRKQQSACRDFYKLAFIDQFEQPSFKKKLDSLQKVLAIEKAKKNQTYKEREKARKEEEKKYEKEGRKIFANKVVILDPYFNIRGKKAEFYIEAEEQKLELDKVIKENARAANINFEFINSKRLKSSDVEQYNRLSLLKEWLQERYAHGDLEIVPLTLDQVAGFSTQFGTKYLMYTGVYCNKYSKRTYYDYYLYDIEKGSITYHYKFKDLSPKYSLLIYKKYLNEFLETIKR